MSILELSRPGVRRARIREGLPTEHPQVMDEAATCVQAFPNPLDLSAGQIVGSLGAVASLRNQMDAYLVELAGAADSLHVATSLHAGTTGTLVAAAVGANPPVGSAMVGTARALRTLPHVQEAFGAGRLSNAHVQSLRHAAHRIDDFADLEAGLVELAASVEPAELRRLLDMLIGQCQPDAAEAKERTQHDKRGLSISETPNGMFRLDGWLDAIEGRRLRDALTAFSHPGPGPDQRTPTQRRADALADIITAACANRRPLGVSGLSILVDLDTLPDGAGATLDDGHLISRESFDLLSCSVACSVIFGTRHGGVFVPLALGRTHRRATAAQWAALIARDHGCIRCGRAPRFCEAHHVLHWRHGGLTDLSNLVLMCSRCHHDLHHGHYTVTFDEHGVPSITSSRAPP